MTLQGVFQQCSKGGGSLAHFLAARPSPRGKQRLARRAALEAELTPLLEWMRLLDADLGRSPGPRQQDALPDNRLRRLAGNFQLAPRQRSRATPKPSARRFIPRVAGAPA